MTHFLLSTMPAVALAGCAPLIVPVIATGPSVYVPCVLLVATTVAVSQTLYKPAGLRATALGWAALAAAYYTAAVQLGGTGDGAVSVARYWAVVEARYVLLPSVLALGLECGLEWVLVRGGIGGG